MAPTQFSKALLVVFLLFSTIVVAELYLGVSRLLSIPLWQGAALLNTLAAALVVKFYWHRPTIKPNNQSKSGLIWWLPSLAIMAAAAAGVLFSGANSTTTLPDFWWLFVFYIPVIEEVCFRFGLSGYLRSRLGLLGGAYLSSLVFTLLHGSITLEQIASGQFGVPIGPLLLACCCELIYIKSRKIGFAILFHSSCNGLAVIWQVSDSQLLPWFEFLFLTTK